MAEFLTRNLKMAISATPEDAYNDIQIASADEYLGLLTTGRAFYVPDKEKIDDTGKVGTGREFATEQRSTYVTVPSVEIAEELNASIAALLLRRAMGGAVTTVGIEDEEENVVAYRHSFGLDYDNRQLPSSSCLWSLGGADYIWGGMVVESFNISQTNAETPNMTATMMGSGIYKQVRYLTSTGALASYKGGAVAYNGPHGAGSPLAPAFPAPEVQHYMVGAESNVVYNIGETEFVMAGASDQRLKSFNFTLTNNHRTDDRRPGDYRVATADPKSGHYVNRMNHGDRTIAVEMTVMLDDEMREFYTSYNDEIVSDFVYTAKGLFLPGTTVQSEVEIAIPKSYFRTVQGADDNGDATLTLSLFPVYDFDVDSIVEASIVNAKDELV